MNYSQMEKCPFWCHFFSFLLISIANTIYLRQIWQLINLIVKESHHVDKIKTILHLNPQKNYPNVKNFELCIFKKIPHNKKNKN